MIVSAPVETLQVVHHVRASRFEALDGGRRVATLEYRLQGAAAVLAHTDLGASGAIEGVATPLITTALDVLVARGHYLVALCPHVRAFLRSHPTYHAAADTRFLDAPGLLAS